VLPALVSGVLVTLCFPVFDLGPLSFLAMTPLFAAVLKYKPTRREAYRAGWLCGGACFVTMLWWIVKLVPSAGVAIPWLMTPALILLVLYLSLYPAFYLLVVGALSRWRPLPFVIAAPATWALFEMARARGELAFPWGVLGYSLSDHPSLIQSADVWGVYGLSFVIVLVNALIAVAVVARAPRTRLSSAVLALVVVAALYGHGSRKLAQEHTRTAGTDTFPVAIAQPNIDLAIKWKDEYRDSSFNQIERQSLQAHEQGARLVVFPETCAPMYIENAPGYKSRLQGLARWKGMPIYVGFLDHRYDGPRDALNIYNSSGVFQVDGTVEKYDKRHLLPFGEALPLSRRFRWIRKIEFGQANFMHGPPRAPLHAGNVAFTPLICFESVFPYLCREGVRDGAQFLVNITNDGWFGDTPGPYQHAQMAILRAVEFRRWLVRSANSGVSMLVTPAGEVTETIDLNVTEVRTVRIGLRDDVTPYARHGDLPLAIGSALLLLPLAITAYRSRSSARP